MQEGNRIGPSGKRDENHAIGLDTDSRQAVSDRPQESFFPPVSHFSILVPLPLQGKGLGVRSPARRRNLAHHGFEVLGDLLIPDSEGFDANLRQRLISCVIELDLSIVNRPI